MTIFALFTAHARTRRTVLLTMMAAGLAVGCKSGASSEVADAVTAPPPAGFAVAAGAAAASLQAQFNNYAIQAPTPQQDCHTLITPADPTVPFRGTAVLFHGHTACPNQFTELSQILAKKGVQTFAPLLPGQGRGPLPTPDLKNLPGGLSFPDYYGQFMPKAAANGWQEYNRFVDAVNTYVAGLPGPKAVGGLSVGGSLATYAYLSQPQLYQNALIINAFYGPPNTYLGRNPSNPTLVNTIAAPIGAGLYLLTQEIVDVASQTISAVASLPITWGPECYADGVLKTGVIPRAGVCDFRLDNLGAVDLFAQTLFSGPLKQLTQVAPATHVQYLMVEFDSAANTVLERQAAALQLAGWGPNQVQICTFAHVVPHSLFARGDLAQVADPFWLNSFLRYSTNFLALGTPYPTDPNAQSTEVAMNPTSAQDTATFLPRCATPTIDYATVTQTN